jgi:DNA-binding beta-propeller fold protein YncE
MGQFRQPSSIAIAIGPKTQYVYVVDTNNNRIQVFNASSHIFISARAGNASTSGGTGSRSHS